MKHFFLSLLLLAFKCQFFSPTIPLSVESGPCLGQCPVYKISVQPDGRYEWDKPKQNHIQKGKLNYKEHRKLCRILSTLDFSKLYTQYGNPKIRDIPEIKVVYGDFKISVKGRNNAPPSLREIIEWSDQLHEKHTSLK